MNREDDATLAAYRVLNPEGPAFSTLSDYERGKWREAYGAARAVTPVILKPTVGIELTEASFNLARTMLGGTPSGKVTICASSVYGRVLIELRDKYGCSVIEIPPVCF